MTIKSYHTLVTPLARTTVPIYHLFRMISITFLQQAPMHLIFEEGILLLRDYLRRRSPTSLRLGRAGELFRAQAHFYRESLNYLKRERITFKNTAPRYQTLSLIQQSPRRGGGVLLHRLRQISDPANGHTRSPAQHAYLCSDHRPDEPMI